MQEVDSFETDFVENSLAELSPQNDWEIKQISTTSAFVNYGGPNLSVIIYTLLLEREVEK